MKTRLRQAKIKIFNEKKKKWEEEGKMEYERGMVKVEI